MAGIKNISVAFLQGNKSENKIESHENLSSDPMREREQILSQY